MLKKGGNPSILKKQDIRDVANRVLLLFLSCVIELKSLLGQHGDGPFFQVGF